MAINLIADGKFHEVETTVKPFEKSSTLVTGGVFRISRNPMYLGFVLILLGIAILLGSLSPYLIVILFWIAMEKVFIETEEKMLESKFGSRWTEYKTSVRRWL
jgi:protein-S-isoprenylcysteine O-methyltransferase Ste14